MARNTGTCGTCFYARNEKGEIPTDLDKRERFICFGCPPHSTVIMMGEKTPLGMSIKYDIKQSRPTVVKNEPACAAWERRNLMRDFGGQPASMLMDGVVHKEVQDAEQVSLGVGEDRGGSNGG